MVTPPTHNVGSLGQTVTCPAGHSVDSCGQCVSSTGHSVETLFAEPTQTVGTLGQTVISFPPVGQTVGLVGHRVWS